MSRGSEHTFRRVAGVHEVAEGEVLPIEVDGVPMILFRIGTRWTAAQRHCPHQGADLSDGLLTEGGDLLCGVHGWRFDGVTGRHDSSDTCLTTYPVRIVDDAVQVAAIPLPRTSP